MRIVSCACCLSLLLVTAVLADVPADRDGDGQTTIEEFNAYVRQRAAGISPKQVREIAELVDADDDGFISEAEFAGRLDAFQSVTSGDAAAKEVGGQEQSEVDYLDGEIATVPTLISTDDATLLLITGDEIAAAWEPFAFWKTRQGKPTRIITVRQIARDYDADSIQEKIRLCVRDHIENRGTRWVLLGGDSLRTGGVVPGGHTTVHDQEREGIPTDIVYVSPTSWDADGDGIYGEWGDDRDAITYPDGSIGLGRVPVRTTEDVHAFTDKVIAYESAYPTSEFASRILYTCTDAPAYPKVRASWDRYLDAVWDGRMQRFFADETPWMRKANRAATSSAQENLVELINQQNVGKLHIHGHGLRDMWMLERSRFDSSHVGLLTNDGAYPLMTTVSCFTGEYDSPQDPSIVESMIRQPNAGSVAIVAPVRTGKPHFHSPADFTLMITEGKLDGTTLLMTRYWLHGLEERLTTGESIMQAKADMSDDAEQTAAFHLCVCELNLLGDPTLDMRPEAPRTPTLNAPLTIPVGRQQVDVETDAPAATLCLWKGLEIYSVVTTDGEGNATFDVEPATTGKLLVTLAGAGLNSVTANIDVE